MYRKLKHVKKELEVLPTEIPLIFDTVQVIQLQKIVYIEKCPKFF